MAVLGLGGLGWMLAIGALAAVEACAAIGPRLRAPLGIALAGVGAAVLATGALPGG
jgi:hypothetical protein